MALAADGRIFVCEQAGRLRVVREGTLLPASFLTVTVDASGERGCSVLRSTPLSN